MSRVATRLGSRAFATAPAAPAPSMSMIRTFGPVGKWLRDQPNLVPEGQKFFQASHEPTYMKKGSDKLVVMVALSSVGLGLVMALKGASSLAWAGARARRGDVFPSFVVAGGVGRTQRRRALSLTSPPLLPSALPAQAPTMRPGASTRRRSKAENVAGSLAAWT
jgi:hypothetical protein